MNTTTTRIFSWKTAVLVSLGAGLLALGLSIFLQTHGLTAEALTAENPPVATVQTSAPHGQGSSFDAPARLIIPAIGVDANIQGVGLAWQGNGEMGIPTNFTDVGWYKDGPLPGKPGSAVIDGHLDGRNVKEAVFYNLGKLKTGDTVEVAYTSGKTVTFKVVNVKTYDLNAPTADIFSSDTSTARLNLITCAGSWDKTQQSYNERVVVFTELVTS